MVYEVESKTLDGIITRTETRGMSVPVYGLENTGRLFTFICRKYLASLEWACLDRVIRMVMSKFIRDEKFKR